MNSTECFHKVQQQRRCYKKYSRCDFATTQNCKNISVLKVVLITKGFAVVSWPAGNIHSPSSNHSLHAVYTLHPWPWLPLLKILAAWSPQHKNVSLSQTISVFWQAYNPVHLNFRCLSTFYVPKLTEFNLFGI